MIAKNRRPRGRTLAITGLMLVAAAGASIAGVTAAHAEDGPMVTATGTSSHPDLKTRFAEANSAALDQLTQECNKRGYTTYKDATPMPSGADNETVTTNYTATCVR